MRRQQRNVETRIKTLSGEIPYKRDYYYCKDCKCGESPRDKDLGIGEISYKMTKGLMAEVAFYGQSQSSFARAAFMLTKALRLTINEETIRLVTEYVGKIVFDRDTKQAEETLSKIHKITGEAEEDSVLYIETDGAAVNTRIEDENGSTWRENKTVLVFRDKDMIRRKNERHIIVKKEYLPYIGTSENFKKYMLEAAVRAGYGKVKKVVIISDGAQWIRNVCNEIFPDAVMILDWYHLKENIYTYAKHKYPGNTAKYTAWAESAIKMIEDEQVDELLKRLPEGEKLPAGCVNLRNYISANRDRITYKKFKDMGYFIGSGAIESGNKLIVQQRLKQAGMRWSVDGAQAVLSLRAKDESNLWQSHVVQPLTAA